VWRNAGSIAPRPGGALPDAATTPERLSIPVALRSQRPVSSSLRDLLSGSAVPRAMCRQCRNGPGALKGLAIGANGEVWYSPDHHGTFRPVS